MKKFVFIYNHHEEPTKELFEAWTAWFKTIENPIDMGSPFGEAKEVNGDSVTDIAVADHRAGGYTIINATDMDEAVEIASRCPGGVGVRVYEAKPM